MSPLFKEPTISEIISKMYLKYVKSQERIDKLQNTVMHSHITNMNDNMIPCFKGQRNKQKQTSKNKSSF